MSAKSILLYFSILFLPVVVSAQAETKFAKVKIELKNKKIADLARLGIETDHGIHEPSRYLINDYSMDEIKKIQNAGFGVEILIHDVEKYYNNPNRPSAWDNITPRVAGCQHAPGTSFDFQNPEGYSDGSMAGYHTYQEMLTMLDNMRALYPDLLSVNYNIDTIPTHMGNRVFYVRVSNEPLQHNPNKPQVLYTALHHAREPNSLSQMLYYMWFLFENYGKNPLVTKILQETQLIFIPCINPDGYKINENNLPGGGGLWRKNGWLNADGQLKGVDLNRNYGYFWGIDNNGSSPEEDSQVFRGVAAFSEPETRAVRAVCKKYNFVSALNYHSFGNLLIHPWGYNSLPTAEDGLFKNIGNNMTRENAYKLGTAVETVGYIVNGGSDDWMYGDTVNKNPVYSFTPEVGYSFWPSPTDINRINRSSVWTNLFAAIVATSYYSAEPVRSWPYLTADRLFTEVKVRRVGLQDGYADIRVESKTPGVFVTTPEQRVSMAQGEEELWRFEFNLDIGRNYPDGIDFELVTKQNGFEERTLISYDFVQGSLSRVFYQPLDDNQDISTEGFVRYENEYYSPPACLKESEFSWTPVNYTAILNINNAADLSDTKAAYFQFYAKWDIEKNYDFAVVEARTESSDFIPLCGLYTKEGTPEQIPGEPVYDGIQKEWIREQIDLKPLIGEKKVWLRIRVQTDDFNSGKGFLIDDLEIVKVSGSLNANDNKPFKAALLSNMSDGHASLELTGNTDKHPLRFSLYNAFGIEVLSVITRDEQIHIAPYQLPAGIYFFSLWNENMTARQTGKLIIVR